MFYAKAKELNLSRPKMSNPFKFKSIPKLNAASLVFLALVLGAGLYRSAGQKASAGQCAGSLSTAQRMAPFAKGEVAAVAVNAKPAQLPKLDFLGPASARLDLDHFKGRTILLNLWATWCVPCRTEMPALDVLQSTLGSTQFEVVSINIDQRNLERPKTFLDEIKVSHLAYYSDPSAATFQSLKTIGKAFGMPTTLIISPEGCELANLAGPADWASTDAQALIKSALGL
eukprot:gene17828-18056_t